MMSYKVQSLNVFPVKSLRGISISAMTLDVSGFTHDREWMLIDAQGKFLTQRQLPRMALINVTIKDHQLLIEAPQAPPLNVPCDVNSQRQTHAVAVKIWNDHCTGLLADQSINHWFSDFLAVDCRLVKFDQSKPRQVDQNYSRNVQDQVQFADGFPFLLIGTASLDDLNRRLRDKAESLVSMMRFRPNIVIETDEPFVEDSWKSIQIGDVTMDVVKPCSRCVIPTIDIQTGVKSKEPIATLMSYRRRDGKIFFGQNLIHQYQTQQTIKVGDLVVSEPQGG